jgi:hypothetical protein
MAGHPPKVREDRVSVLLTHMSTAGGEHTKNDKTMAMIIVTITTTTVQQASYYVHSLFPAGLEGCIAPLL